MTPLPVAIHSAAQVRAMDRYAIEKLGVPGYTMMTRAGAAGLRELRSRWPQAKRIAVVCGSGNNAGDGYVLARLAREVGLTVDVIALFDPRTLQGDAQKAWQDFVAAGGAVLEWSESVLAASDVIVDAIFGTGLSRPLDARLCAQIEALNAACAPILSLDIPSGLHADSGQALGAAVHADCTVTFVGLKLGCYLGVAPDYIGELVFDALDTGVADAQVGSVAQRIDVEWLPTVLPRRSRLAHKGSHGHVLIVGGGAGMAGAAALAGTAALRVGAGLVTVATCPDNVASISSARAELIVRAVKSVSELQPLIDRADVIAIGPGLGQDGWASVLVDAVLASDKPLVVDADALNLLAAQPRKRGRWILTPHPGEAGRLLGISTHQVQQDRLASAQSLLLRYGGVCVLKGARSLVVREGDVPSICDRGNPGMATAGMGDVLTGAIAGVAAQVGDLWTAARAGVLAHALAGDAATNNGERGLIASDLFARLRTAVNPNA